MLMLQNFAHFPKVLILHEHYFAIVTHLGDLFKMVSLVLVVLETVNIYVLQSAFDN